MDKCRYVKEAKESKVGDRVLLIVLPFCPMEGLIEGVQQELLYRSVNVD